MLDKHEDELYLSITLFDEDESKRKEYRIKNISTESCEQAYQINEKMFQGNCDLNDLLHDVVNFIVEFFGNQFTYQDVVYGIPSTQLQALISILFAACGSLMVFEGQKEKGEELLLVSTYLYNEAVK